jgi:hypothetical protein
MADPGSIAKSLEDVELGIACAGTALEARSYSTGKKAFLFVAKEQARLKLVASAPEAKELGFAVGASGWVTLALDRLPAAAVLRRWIVESHALAAGAKAGKRATIAKQAVPRKKA